MLNHDIIMTGHTSSLQSAWALNCSRVFTMWGYPYPEATCSTHWPLCISQYGASSRHVVNNQRDAYVYSTTAIPAHAMM